MCYGIGLPGGCALQKCISLFMICKKWKTVEMAPRQGCKYSLVCTATMHCSVQILKKKIFFTLSHPVLTEKIRCGLYVLRMFNTYKYVTGEIIKIIFL